MNAQSARTFLAANSSYGFISYFDNLTENTDTVIIKGGPGTGKSTFMKRIAEKALLLGKKTEYIYCSSDCDSLDGIYFPELNTAVCDGTPPHIVEPVLPGAKDRIEDLGRFWNADILKKERVEIEFLTSGVKDYYEQEYSFLGAAGEAKRAFISAAGKYEDKHASALFTEKFLNRLFTSSEGSGGVLRKRFLSAYSHRGFVTFKDTVYNLAEHVYVLKDTYGIADTIIKRICHEALARNFDVWLFSDPLLPHRAAHIAIPELNIAVCSSTRELTFETQDATVTNLSRFISRDISFIRNKLSYIRKIYSMCIKGALDAASKAKQIHDDLEEYYISAMDFASVSKAADETAENIFTRR